MSPGDFEPQIRAGIDSSDYLVLVMTPGALRSPWVKREWRYARENGRCIVPIKPAFDSPATERELEALRAQLPVWMQKIQTYDFDRYWKRFVAVLQSPCQATRAPFLAASLPANFASILAARFAAEALVADGLSAETRSRIIQRLVPMALPDTTALDTVLGRLMLSTLARPAALPPLLKDLAIPDSADVAANRPEGWYVAPT